VERIDEAAGGDAPEAARAAVAGEVILDPDRDPQVR
jgi:hypothetical protein